MIQVNKGNTACPQTPGEAQCCWLPTRSGRGIVLSPGRGLGGGGGSKGRGRVEGEGGGVNREEGKRGGHGGLPMQFYPANWRGDATHSRLHENWLNSTICPLPLPIHPDHPHFQNPLCGYAGVPTVQHKTSRPMVVSKYFILEKPHFSRFSPNI